MLFYALLSVILGSGSTAPVAAAATSPSLDQCRSAIGRKVEGDVSAMDVASTRRSGATTTIRGVATALVGMGDPGPQRAKAHHLIRERYQFTCAVRAAKVRKLSLMPTS